MVIRRKEALAAPTSLFVTSRLWATEVSWGQGKCDPEQGDEAGTLILPYAFRPRGTSQSQAQGPVKQWAGEGKRQLERQRERDRMN